MTGSFQDAFNRAKVVQAVKSAKMGDIEGELKYSKPVEAQDKDAAKPLQEGLSPIPESQKLITAPACAAAVGFQNNPSLGAQINQKLCPLKPLYNEAPWRDPATRRPTIAGPAIRPQGYQSIPNDWQAPRSVIIPKSTRSQPHYRHLREPAELPPPVLDRVTLKLARDAALHWHGGNQKNADLLRRPVDLGCRTELVSGKVASTREVVLGFDFGTSSTKVVLGDRSLRQAYAVQFRDAVGIDAYLLPARLYEENGCYNLHGGAQVLSDLKLSLVANPKDVDRQARVVAYLALAIQEARGWLFTAHADSYANTAIIWVLALGLPADQATSCPLTQLYQRLGHAAWAVAGAAAAVSSVRCVQALQNVERASVADLKVEVNVIPEIAAQIYGFVNSDQFDPNSRNIFLMVDVGAGTVDSCLFRVFPMPPSRWSFEVYTAAVEPTGVMNLHRYRVDWWQQQLRSYAQRDDLIHQIEAIKLSTDHQSSIPNSFLDYFKGVTVQLSGKLIGPDKEFFNNEVVGQVRGRNLFRAFRERLLGKQDLGEVPFFLCGGGSRMGYYRDLHEALRKVPGCHSLGARPRELAIPKDLRMEGVMQSDYDRLSVAYGLSMLNLANVVDASHIPRLPPVASDGRRNHYIDKDQV